ncbi:sulfatase family protein [Sediminicola luteus]|uniref:Sulfatase N-terminal domain-containing protein n=1 Tax=Sediminicola luteus TaxID=319238 RepID=A0A2A4G533_9FLAO|nr:sulfatase [Sediminicola luteus]PCE63757.1 hypothetical protein B7P33_10810 [Sediminicola luteus]
MISKLKLPLLLLLTIFSNPLFCQQSKKIKNVLLITVDDMNYNSVGVYGASVPDITPNIDKLAAQGMRFENAHVNIAVCAPSRGVLATGMYPHKSGIEGFFKTDKNVTSIVEVLKDENFLTGVLSKEEHSSPEEDTPWDVKRSRAKHLGNGRDANKYYNEVVSFIKRAKRENKPFYLMANANDPHRPFSGSDQEQRAWKNQSIAPPSKIYLPNEVEVPAFLPDIPKVRQEIAEYYTSVRRADDVVGAILKALDESGKADNTLVMFLSDHGMALPFAKTNCYLNSTKTPWIVRWPEVVKPKSVDNTHFISGIDFMPTVLDILNIETPKEIDGRSFKKLLLGGKQEGRTYVYTQFHETSARERYPMRAIQDNRYLYIFSPWADGKRKFRNESQNGRTFKAMREAAFTNEAIANRVDLFVNRVTEEFYDLEKDPDALHNLIHNPSYKKRIEAYTAKLRKWMIDTEDLALEAFDNRYSKEFLALYMNKDQARNRK